MEHEYSHAPFLLFKIIGVTNFMEDPHLNIFYSYNRDNELIENNMTRAFIVLLKYLSNSNKNQLLSILFHEPYQNKSIGLALQANIDKSIPHKSQVKKIITLTDYGCVESLEIYNDSRKYQEVGVSYRNKPDAWIFDSEQYEFCYLIEAKHIGVELEAVQYISYAKQYFNYSYAELEQNIINITWHDILQALQIINANEQELILISDFEEYLLFCGIKKLFNGFNWEILKSPCSFKFSISSVNIFPPWDKLFDSPQFNLSTGEKI
ncbi:MAG: hypothetical protein FWH53_04640 [Leptospirales bacterium]|nr:hypothetical protein [Leptospirales bacterium]